MLDQDNVIGRHKPASGVRVSLDQPTIVYVTVCTEKRVPWLAQPGSHELLRRIWGEAQAWLVGYYLFMPDHIHFFCAPHDLQIPLNRWMSYWKRLFTQQSPDPSWQWQALHWDRRLRRSENYQQKWQYIRENPAKKGLAPNPDAWPYQGMLNVLQW